MAIPEWLLTKSLTVRVNKMIELFLPPVLADRKWIACLFNYFQGRGFRYYDVTKNPMGFPRCNRVSDCTETMLMTAADLVVGKRVLDIGCGSGRFIKQLAANNVECTGVDPNQKNEKGDNWQISKGIVEDFNFPESSFDTVVSFKTLEHIPDPKTVLQSWKKLARYRIVLVLPCQRYRRYVYDGHINFFPDEFQLRNQLGLPEHAVVEKLDYDWLVYEDVTPLQR
ncbi:MAG: class I SAM-dependent methyltransferase [Desulfuromonadales bacterium]|nr:class I SAM-dependent methyltransferase [Desulfuromonadales bacterium]